MSVERDLAESLASWTPPWQRESSRGSDEADEPVERGVGGDAEEESGSAGDLGGESGADAGTHDEDASDSGVWDGGLDEAEDTVAVVGGADNGVLEEVPGPDDAADLRVPPPWAVDDAGDGELSASSLEAPEPVAPQETPGQATTSPKQTVKQEADQAEPQVTAPSDGEDEDKAQAGAGPDGDAAADSETATPPVDVTDPVQMRSVLEAILLVVDEPVSEVTLAQILERSTEEVTRALTALAEEYTAARRGMELRHVGGGWRLYTRADYAAYVERFVLNGQQVRLTQAALETLAVVAYKQPITRARVSAIRGVNCDGVIRTLVTRGLIEECGTEPESGAYLYRTTPLFLERLGINSLEELPPLAPFLPDDVESLADALTESDRDKR